MVEGRVSVHREDGMHQLNGALDLVCSRDRNGKTYLSRQAFNVPFHLSKPYWTGRTLLVQIVNPTAGLFSSDRLTSRIVLQEETAAAVTTPSATRVYVSKSGQTTFHQHFVVSADAWLDFTPAMLIPQAGSKYAQKTKIELAKGSSGLYLESMAPGRVASGESLAFDLVEWESDVYYDGDLLLKERFRLQPGDGSLLGLQRPFANAFFASGFVVSDGLRDYREISTTLRERVGAEVYIGLSPIEEYFWTLRLLSSSSIGLRRTVSILRELLTPCCPLLGEPLRGNISF